MFNIVTAKLSVEVHRVTLFPKTPNKTTGYNKKNIPK